MTLRDQLTDAEVEFTPSERKVVRALLVNYPVAGLQTVSHLARQAGVSDPTVLRLATKLGYSGFLTMQQTLLAEIEARMSWPLTMLSSRTPNVPADDIYGTYAEASIAAIRASTQDLLPADFRQAVKLMSDAKARLFCIGGRFSGFLAGVLYRHLVQLRPGAVLVNGSAADLAETVSDLSRRDVVVAFDYRRYQHDVIAFAEQAHERGARIILMTDRWQSPISGFASVILTAPVDTISPFDTLVPALVQTEALVVALTTPLDQRSRKRLANIERYRLRNRVAVDAPHGRERTTA